MTVCLCSSIHTFIHNVYIGVLRLNCNLYVILCRCNVIFLISNSFHNNNSSFPQVRLAGVVADEGAVEAAGEAGAMDPAAQRAKGAAANERKPCHRVYGLSIDSHWNSGALMV